VPPIAFLNYYYNDYFGFVKHIFQNNPKKEVTRTFPCNRRRFVVQYEKFLYCATQIESIGEANETDGTRYL
jgi:hypothetical protein